MARYPALFTLGIPVDQLHTSLSTVLQGCDLNMIYDTPEYVMAREVPGKVAFTKLVTVEILIDRTTATPEKVQLKLVVKNEELPLQSSNHCAVKFGEIKTAMETAAQWQLIESYTGEDDG
jgi:hypothetical protein